MTSVTAKKLRDNLSEYLDRLQEGEEIRIIRHSEIIGSLKPSKRTIKGNGKTVARMLARGKEVFSQNGGLTDQSTPIDELYKKALVEKNR